MQGNTNAFGSAGGLGDTGYQKLADGALKINFNENTPQTVKVGTVEDWTNSGVLAFCGGISDLAVANNNLDIVSDNTEIGAIRLSHTTNENTCNSVYLTNNGISLAEEAIEINRQTGISTLQTNENSVATWQNLISTANGESSNYIKAVSSTAQDLQSVINSKVEQGEFILESEMDLYLKGKDHFNLVNSEENILKISTLHTELGGVIKISSSCIRLDDNDSFTGLGILKMQEPGSLTRQVSLYCVDPSDASGTLLQLSENFYLAQQNANSRCQIASGSDSQGNLGIHVSGSFFNIPDITSDTDDSMQAATVKYVRSKISSIDFSPYQTTANLVTSITDQSTDSQYPSAKAVYDLLNALTTRIATLEAKVTALESQVSNTEAELNNINSGE